MTPFSSVHMARGSQISGHPTRQASFVFIQSSEVHVCWAGLAEGLDHSHTFTIILPYNLSNLFWIR